MISVQRLEKRMGIILLAGIILALFLVTIGGAWYLLENGSAPLKTDILQISDYQTSISQIWRNAFSFTPASTIELGLFILIVTQLVRVGLLVWFYFRLKDRWFTAFSLLIFLVLVYSLFSGNIQ